MFSVPTTHRPPAQIQRRYTALRRNIRADQQANHPPKSSADTPPSGEIFAPINPPINPPKSSADTPASQPLQHI
jgi:hypothetical protein